MNAAMPGPEKTPSIETRVYSMIFRIRSSPFIKRCEIAWRLLRAVVGRTMDVVNGYIIVDAKDLAEAAELSKGCPNLEIGGSVEVRPVRRM